MLVIIVQAPDTVVSDLDPKYKVAPGEFVLDERYMCVERERERERESESESESERE